MPTYATPGVYFERADQAIGGISAVRTDIAAFLGIAQMGPVNQPVPVNTWEQFQSAFGTFLPNAYLAYSAKAFFDNGGQKLYIVRVAAPRVSATTAGLQASRAFSIVTSISGFATGAVVTASQTSAANTLGAQPGDRASSLVDTVAGFIEGTIVRINQAAPAPLQVWRKVRSVDSGTKRLRWDNSLDAAFSLANPIVFTAQQQQDLLIGVVDPGSMKLTWGSPLVETFDLTQSISFESGASAATGDFYDTVGNPTLRVAARSPGMWGDKVSVEVSHSSLASTVAVGMQPTGGSASLVATLTGFPIWSVVRVYQFVSPGPQVLGYRIVRFVDPVAKLIGWDSPLAPQFDITKPISFESVEFGLTVAVAGRVREAFGGLSLQAKHPRYVEKAVQSNYIDVTNLNSPGPLPFNLPDPGNLHLSRGRLYLKSGRDGVAALRGSDFIGDPAMATKLGLRSLEDVDEVGIIAAPDIAIEPAPAVLRAPVPEQPVLCCGDAPLPPPGVSLGLVAFEAAPTFSLEDVWRVQQAMIQHCETLRFPFAILDSPNFGYPDQNVELSEVQGWRQRFDTEFAALYLPWVLVSDPLLLGNQVVRKLPPSGHVAGLYANTDLTVGVHKAPANTALAWVQGLTGEITENAQRILNPMGVDCLRTFRGRGIRVYGARTLSSESSWKLVNVRRLMSMIERALLLALQWVVFESNNPLLQHKIQVTISSFLEAIWRKGALAGNTAEESFYVKCDGTNNTLATNQAGELIVEIGVAPALPAEFIVFRIGRSEDVLEVTEQ